MSDRQARTRADDRGFLCVVALRAGQFWDFMDRRQIDAYIVSLGVFYGTVLITGWAMNYAEAHSNKSGLEVAAVMAAILAPYMALQAAAIKFYFDARSRAFHQTQPTGQ